MSIAARVVLALTLVGSGHVYGQEICQLLNGAIIVAQDQQNTVLGKVTNSFDSDSIFNEFGTYGNGFSSKSIWNQFSTFGNEFNSESPFNEFSTHPPMLIKGDRVIGYLSANSSNVPAISPALLKALCKDEF